MKTDDLNEPQKLVSPSKISISSNLACVRGQIHEKLENRNKAVRFYTYALQLDPKNYHVCY